LLPNFFDPDISSCVTAKMTPYNANTTNNKSYLNTNSNHRLSLHGTSNRLSMNANGSFIENNNRQHRTPLKDNKTETQMNTLMNGGNVPTFKISDTDAVESVSSSAKKFIEQCCKNCQKKFISQQSRQNQETVNNRKRKAVENGKDLLSEFNLNIEDYSPNKKCANYIDANSFSPCLNNKGNYSSPNSPSGTPQSTAKKSLLAKAITNNVTNTIMTSNVASLPVSADANTSLNTSTSDQFSCISNCSGNTSLVDVSPTKSSPSKSSRFTEMDLNEDEAVDDDECELNESICEECKIKEAKIDYIHNGEDRSEVSLIMGI
jgi:hypothetical protein